MGECSIEYDSPESDVSLNSGWFQVSIALFGYKRLGIATKAYRYTFMF